MDIKSAEFKAVDFEPLLLVGKRTVVAQGKTATKFVKQFREGRDNAYLQGVAGRATPEGDIAIWMGDFDEATRSFVEIPGVLVKPDSRLEGEYDIKELPRCTMGVCVIKGSTRSITRGAHSRLVKLMAEAGYAPDYSYGFSMEYYSREKYEKDNDEYTFAYLLPCRRAGE